MSDAWRLTFAYDGDEFTLKSKRRLAKRVPPGQPLNTDHVGRFIELRDSKRQVLYRRGITELISGTVEYPTGDPARPLGRVPARRRGEVAILVPALPEGHAVAIIATGRPGPADKSTIQSGAQAGTPRDLITVELPREGEQK